MLTSKDVERAWFIQKQKVEEQLSEGQNQFHVVEKDRETLDFLSMLPDDVRIELMKRNPDILSEGEVR